VAKAPTIRSRKSNIILGLTYFKSTGSSGRQKLGHGRDIRADYVDFVGHWEVTQKKPKMWQCHMLIDQNGKKAMHECKLLDSVSYNLITPSECALSMPCTSDEYVKI